MIIRSVSFQDLGRWRGKVQLPIEELGAARLVALRGDCGEGKSTALGCIPGALYRRMPDHGRLTDIAHGKQAWLEVVAELDGGLYTFRHQIDALQRKVTSIVVDPDGKPLSDRKRDSFVEAVALLLPPESVFLASVFAAQEAGGSFSDLPGAERRQLFVDLLGHAHYAEKAKVAKQRYEAVVDDVARLQDKLPSVSADLEALERNVTEQEAEGLQVEHDLAAVEKAKRAHETELERWNDARNVLLRDVADAERMLSLHQLDAKHGEESNALARGEVKRLADERQSLTDTFNLTMADLRGQLEKLRDQVARRDDWIADRAKLPGLQSEADELQQSMENQDAVYATWEKQNLQWTQQSEALNRDLVEALERYQRELAGTEDAEAQAEQSLKHSNRAAAEVDAVPCEGQVLVFRDEPRSVDCSICPLIETAVEQRDLTNERADALVLARNARDAMILLDPRPEPMKAIEHHGDAPVEPPIDTDLPKQLEALRGNIKAAELAGLLAQQAEGAPDELDHVLELIDSRSRDTERKLDELAEEQEATNLTEKTTRESSEHKAGEAEWSSGELAKHRSKATNHDLHKPSMDGMLDLNPLRLRQQECAAGVALARDQIKRARQSEADTETIREALERAAEDLDDWREARRVLAPAGVPALEIDSARPEVDQLTNDLLRACFGERFTVELVTMKPKGKGKQQGTKEELDLMVTDTERGRRASVNTYSGGEKVIIGQCLRIAIAIFNRRRSSVPLRDLFLDECSGALDEQHAHRYVAMLRRALDLGDFHRVYFIAHQQYLWPLADQVMRFKDGRIWIDGGEEEDKVAA